MSSITARVDNRPSSKVEVKLLTPLHKFVAQVANRLGPRFSASALINQFLEKDLEGFAEKWQGGRVASEKQAIVDKVGGPETTTFLMRIPNVVLEQFSAVVGYGISEPAFHQALEDAILLSVYEFRETGPLKGRAF